MKPAVNTTKGLRALYDNFQRHFRSLEAMQQDTNQAVFVPMMTLKNSKGCFPTITKKGKRKVQGVPQSQTTALPRPQDEEEPDKSKQAQIEQTYEKH